MNAMNPPRSAYDQIGGMYYFPRMLDKIRLFAAGKFPPDYHANLGEGGDAWCCGFLRIDYAKLRERVLTGGSDEEILEWCYANGRSLNEHDVWVWNQCASRIGWRDAGSKRLEQIKAENGLADRKDIVTMMDFFDVDEGRKP
jgi:gluconokinase